MDQFMTAFLGGYRKDLVDERLKELVGHTPLQVLMGALLGVLIAVLIGM